MHYKTAARAALVASLAGLAQAGAFSAQGVPATNYQQAGTPGACGSVTQNTDLGVALNMQLFDSGDYCGKTVRITKPDGSTSDAPVVDRCGPGGTCSNQGGIDTTNQLFANLGGNIAGAALALDSTIGYGHVTVSFEILDGDASAGSPSQAPAAPGPSGAVGGVQSAVGGAVGGVFGGNGQRRHKRSRVALPHRH